MKKLLLLLSITASFYCCGGDTCTFTDENPIPYHPKVEIENKPVTFCAAEWEAKGYKREKGESDELFEKRMNQKMQEEQEEWWKNE